MLQKQQIRRQSLHVSAEYDFLNVNFAVPPLLKTSIQTDILIVPPIKLPQSPQQNPHNSTNKNATIPPTPLLFCSSINWLYGV